ncbi:SAM-dependent methyltransferase [Saccharopolyspora sp. K220]|uniref:SAM-dependent methyltransferase n=1 Tax=Saccharopolyspora soli TaxID=2926618 RepID=UPI001F58C6B7|nr:SAM-dependent methyltransferase [Saccharopolyspora soli]MCI2423123.1 SAM-dependent methyltransferase [Saccharopolyspora soli]
MANAAAQTAVGPMVIVAVDQHEEVPLVRDKLAYRLLPTGAKVITALTRWQPARRMMINGTERQLPGLWASMLCRKRYIDDQLQAAVEAGVDAVVILGAGLDTRAYRLPYLANTPVYEFDQPANVTRKRAAVQRLYGRVPAHVTLVPIDFETQDLGAALADHGLAGGRIAFVWEAVSQYLTEPAVRRMFESLCTAASGSRLVFTYVRKDFLDGTALYGAEAAYRKFVVEQRLWRFGFDPERVADFLGEYGWREVDQAGPREFAARYLLPHGRAATASEVERSAAAEKR